MKKIISFGKVAYYGKNKSNLVEISIELKNKDKAKDWETLAEVNNVPELSICGGIWNNIKTDYYTCGQCLDTIKEYLPYNKKVARIVEIWEQYHLNDMNAGTKKQTDFLDILKAAGWKYDYIEACEQLKATNLYEDNGYKYGHGWLYRPIPENILLEVNQLLS